MRAWFLLLTIVALAAIPAAAQQPTTTTEKPAAVKAEKPSAPAATLVNLNTATQAQLESLPGVGPKLAERVLDYRQKNGQFKKLEDLMNVQGIGEKNFLKLKPLLTVTEKAAPSGAQSR